MEIWRKISLLSFDLQGALTTSRRSFPSQAIFLLDDQTSKFSRPKIQVSCMISMILVPINHSCLVLNPIVWRQYMEYVFVWFLSFSQFLLARTWLYPLWPTRSSDWPPSVKTTHSLPWSVQLQLNPSSTKIRYVPPKRRYPPIKLQGVATHKTRIWIIIRFAFFHYAFYSCIPLHYAKKFHLNKPSDIFFYCDPVPV